MRQTIKYGKLRAHNNEETINEKHGRYFGLAASYTRLTRGVFAKRAPR
jgi:hypothetical protein